MKWQDIVAPLARGLVIALALLGAGVVVTDGRVCVPLAALPAAAGDVLKPSG